MGGNCRCWVKKKRIKAGATTAVGLLDGTATKKQKRIESQLYNKQYSIVRHYYGKKIKRDREKKD